VTISEFVRVAFFALVCVPGVQFFMDVPELFLHGIMGDHRPSVDLLGRGFDISALWSMRHESLSCGGNCFQNNNKGSLFKGFIRQRRSVLVSKSIRWYDAAALRKS
jgi:hypothetical protein